MMRSRAAAAALLATLTLGGCSAAPVPSTSPTASTPSTSPTATLAPTLTPSEGPSPSPSPTVAVACDVQTDEGRLPSDRLVDVRVSETGDVDVVTFVFGDPSSPAPPQGSSTGAIRAVVPPFTAAASGQEIDVPGEHHVEIKFTGMTLYDDSGTPTYDGPTDFNETLPALRAIAQYDAFEGQSGWIIGFDGPGCVTLSSEAGTVSVVIAHDAG